jgi:hypothetical protein
VTPCSVVVEYQRFGESYRLHLHQREPFEKFVDWRQCAAVMQREAVTVMPSCSGGGNVAVA